MTTQTLLLNASMEPLKVIPWVKALSYVLRDKVYVLESYDAEIRSPSICLKIPAVVALKKYVPYRSRVTFSRKNIYVRDDFTCQYCGRNANELPGKVKGLTFDHILPRCQGGVTSWKNIVAACRKCNNFKAGRTPAQARMKLLREPFEPEFVSMVTLPMTQPTTPDEWVSYLYWETDLDEG